MLNVTCVPLSFNEVDGMHRFRTSESQDHVVFVGLFQYQLRCCIYHGPEPMCSVNNSGQYEPSRGLITFNETIEFADLDVKNIPRMARLCFMFAEVVDAKSKNRRPVTGNSVVKRIRDNGQVRSVYLTVN